MSNIIKTIFIGTPDFALPGLRALIADPMFEVVGVVTQPDKPVGRKQILTKPPVKTEAKKHNIPTHQPSRISDLRSTIYENVDLIVVIAYSQIIPKKILNAPKYGVINVHGSLLPVCRGAACIQWPIINGDKKTGVTIMKMDKGLDTGPILAQKSIPIKSNDTTGSLFEKISKLGAEILIPTLKDYISGKIKPIAQDETKANYVGMIKKSDGLIDFKKPAVEVERFIRAMTPWPGAFSEIVDRRSEIKKIIKILSVRHNTLDINQFKAGEMFEHDGALAVQCGKNALIIEKIQVAGKKPISGSDFVKGYNIKDITLTHEANHSYVPHS